MAKSLSGYASASPFFLDPSSCDRAKRPCSQHRKQKTIDIWRHSKWSNNSCSKDSVSTLCQDVVESQHVCFFLKDQPCIVPFAIPQGRHKQDFLPRCWDAKKLLHLKFAQAPCGAARNETRHSAVHFSKSGSWQLGDLAARLQHSCARDKTHFADLQRSPFSTILFENLG